MRKEVWLVLAGTMALLLMLAAAARYFGPKQADPQAAAEPAKPSAPAAAASGGDLSGSLLDQMRSPSEHGQTDTSQPAPSDEQLESAYQMVVTLERQTDALKAEAASLEKAGNRDLASQKLEVVRAELANLDQRLLNLQSDLRRARAVRPDDAVLHWLTGELLMLVGGEPEEILPYLKRAADQGLQRRQAFTSLARVQLESNQFDAALASARKALDLEPASRDGWEMYGGTALAVGQFEDVIRRVDRAFPQSRPPWADAIRQRADTLDREWKEEENSRIADASANLPRVRLMIEHQTFTNAEGRGDPVPRAIGRDEVEIELFEDQAPATVANFLTLVEQGFYNGTRFHWVEAASMAVGGDPNTKNGDAADDGLGGPGYVIPDEFHRPGARLHFRGTVAMVESGPHTAGSQFFIELVPHPEMNGHMTAFGRVVRGQDGVDRLTPGRTNMRFGKFGKNIPGDLLVRAEVIRKRNHPYRVVKESASR